MSEITAFTGTIEGRFVDDDDLRQSGRAWVEIDNATGLLTLPVSAEYQALRSEVVQSAEAAAGSAAAAAGVAEAVESHLDAAESARDAAVIARDEAEGHAAAAAGSAQAADAAAGRAETAAGSTQWDGDRLTVMGVQSPPLTGPQGPQGPPGEAGDGTGDVLWSELHPMLAGKADVGHTHTPASIGAAPASHTHDADQITTGGTTLYVLLDMLFDELDAFYPRIDTVDARIDTRKGVIHSGTGNPPSSIPGAVVGDWWLNETDMSLYKITSL